MYLNMGLSVSVASGVVLMEKHIYKSLTQVTTAGAVRCLK